MRNYNTAVAAAGEEGIAAHRAGRFEEALAQYRSALALAPQDAEIASLIGLSLAKSGPVGYGQSDRGREPLQAFVTRERAAAAPAPAVRLRMICYLSRLSHLDIVGCQIRAAKTHFADVLASHGEQRKGRRFAARLGPLLDALAAGGIDLETGGFCAESRMQDPGAGA